jgi:rhodanese-related sulfurtransferase
MLNSIKKGEGTIVDVRSREEFAMGNVKGSINIPLQEVGSRIDEFNAFQKPLLLVCASGNRSGMAAMMLQSAGVECTNAGGWMDVHYQLSMESAS